MKRILVVLLALVMVLCFTACSTPETLQELVKRIAPDVNDSPIMGEIETSLDTSIFEYELPDISKYPLSTEGNADINVEIAVPDTGITDFITEVARKFNSLQNKVNSKTVSVSILPMDPNLLLDYILYDEYIPKAYVSPSEMWGEIVSAYGIKARLITNHLAKDIIGIIIKEDKYRDIEKKYEDISTETIIVASNNEDLLIGYPDPYRIPTGLNFVITMLSHFDSVNPNSMEAAGNFMEFQKAIPFSYYTTEQMIQATNVGILDSFPVSYQSYLSIPDMSENYKFIPLGVRQDNPLYAIGDISEEEYSILEMFANFCQSKENEAIARDKYHLNSYNGYESDVPNYSGDVILSALQIWKSEKDIINPVIAIFVTDISGSMRGDPIAKEITSLINASQYINSNNMIGLISYSNSVFINLKPQQFNKTQQKYFIGEVNDLKEDGGGTATYNAVAVALDQLLKVKEQYPEGKMMMVVLSDGKANAGYSFNVIKSFIEGKGVVINTIAYGANASSLEELKKLSELTGGVSLNAEDYDDISYLLKTLFNSQT